MRKPWLQIAVGAFGVAIGAFAFITSGGESEPIFFGALFVLSGLIGVSLGAEAVMGEWKRCARLERTDDHEL